MSHGDSSKTTAPAAPHQDGRIAAKAAESKDPTAKKQSDLGRLGALLGVTFVLFFLVLGMGSCWAWSRGRSTQEAATESRAASPGSAAAIFPSTPAAPVQEALIKVVSDPVVLPPGATTPMVAPQNVRYLAWTTWGGISTSCRVHKYGDSFENPTCGVPEPSGYDKGFDNPVIGVQLKNDSNGPVQIVFEGWFPRGAAPKKFVIDLPAPAQPPVPAPQPVPAPAPPKQPIQKVPSTILAGGHFFISISPAQSK